MLAYSILIDSSGDDHSHRQKIMADTNYQLKYQQALGKIKAAEKILLLTHFNPDGDSLSSICAMAELMEQLGKNYLALAPTEPPQIFSFLPHLEKIRYFAGQSILNDGRTFGQKEFLGFDLVLVLDCGSMSRTRLETEIKGRGVHQYLIEFDHHPKVDDYADLEIRDPEAAATAEILYYFFKTNRLKINKAMAQCLLTGILTDTGNFLFPATTEGTVQIASEMLSLGARLPRILENTLKNKSLAAMQLWGKAMAGLKINSRYNLAISALTLEDQGEIGANKDDIDGISNFLGNLYDVKAVLLLRQESDNLIRGNFRTSRHDVDLSRLANLLGGGGHAKAAGFTIEGKIEKTSAGWKIV